MFLASNNKKEEKFKSNFQLYKSKKKIPTLYNKQQLQQQQQQKMQINQLQQSSI